MKLCFPGIALIGWVVMGCSSGAASNARTSNAAVSTDGTAQAGEACGGDSGPTCNAGLSCDYAPGAAPSDPGRCFEHRAANESCNPTVWPAILCQDGLTCVRISTLVGASGTCQPPAPAAAGDECGGSAHLACQAGLECVATSMIVNAKGTCRAPTPAPAAAGEVCGGSAHVTCQDGLECIAISAIVGAQGTCRAPTPAPAPAAAAGQDCGGTAQVQCQDGLTCDFAPDAQGPDATGRCFEHRAQGAPCNATVWPPLLCADGLRCAPDSTLMGAGGTCQPS